MMVVVLTRRRFIAMGGIGAAALCAERRAMAVGEGAKFAIARLKYKGGSWDPRPGAFKRLLWEVQKRTSIESRAKEPVIELSDPALFRTPFLSIVGSDAYPAWSDGDVQALRRYVNRGGFLLFDNAAGTEGSGFDESVRREVRRLYPEVPFAPIPKDHVIYKSFYLCPSATGRVAADFDLHGVDRDERTAIVYSRNDLAGAWMRDSFGRWTHEVTPGGERQREAAFRLGVNIVMYSLCIDYKRDQVHVQHLLRRRTPYAP